MTISSSRFTSINEEFTCEHCGKTVPPCTSGCRNHCPHCLRSKHVDILPGDRAQGCQGIMDPVAYEQNGKKGIVITFLCRRCGFKGRNKAALQDKNLPDSFDEILRIKMLT